MQREVSLQHHLSRAGVCSGSEETPQQLTVPEAIAIIQRHERARQARARAQLARALATAKVRLDTRTRQARARAQLARTLATVRVELVTSREERLNPLWLK